MPGHPQDSILPYRLRSDEPGVMMPEQGRTTTHVEGVALIEQWIADIDAEPAIRPHSVRDRNPVDSSKGNAHD